MNTDSIEDVVIAAEEPSTVPPEPAAKAPVPSGSSRKAIVNTDSIDPQEEALVLQLEPQPEPQPEPQTDPAAAGPVSHPSRKAIINTDSIEAYKEDNLDDKFERFRAATAVAPGGVDGGQKVSMGSSDGEGGSVNYIVNPLRAVSPGDVEMTERKEDPVNSLSTKGVGADVLPELPVRTTLTQEHLGRERSASNPLFNPHAGQSLVARLTSQVGVHEWGAGALYTTFIIFVLVMSENMWRNA